VKWESAFDELTPGDAFETPSRTVGEDDVLSFAALTGDMHPQHVDGEWARESVFGERIAHGMLVLSYAVGLIPLDPSRVVALRALRDVVFKRPVRLGDAVRVRGTVEELAGVSDSTGVVRCRWSVLNQRDELCVRADVDILWRRDLDRVRAGAAA
jgi:3-hydroxybutyryl-CoA dehydratase